MDRIISCVSDMVKIF